MNDIDPIGGAHKYAAGVAERRDNPLGSINIDRGFSLGGQALFTLSMKPAQALAEAGYSRDDIRRYILGHAYLTPRLHRRHSVAGDRGRHPVLLGVPAGLGRLRRLLRVQEDPALNTEHGKIRRTEMKEKVEEAIADLRAMMQLDGADLKVIGADDASATFAIDLEKANCADCVLPSSMIQPVLAQRLAETIPQITEVVVRDPRDEGTVPDATEAS